MMTRRQFIHRSLQRYFVEGIVTTGLKG